MPTSADIWGCSWLLFLGRAYSNERQQPFPLAGCLAGEVVFPPLLIGLFLRSTVMRPFALTLCRGLLEERGQTQAAQHLSAQR